MVFGQYRPTPETSTQSIDRHGRRFAPRWCSWKLGLIVARVNKESGAALLGRPHLPPMENVVEGVDSDQARKAVETVRITSRFSLWINT